MDELRIIIIDEVIVVVEIYLKFWYDFYLILQLYTHVFNNSIIINELLLGVIISRVNDLFSNQSL